MNYRLIARLLGFIMGAPTAAFVVCIGVGLVYAEEVMESRAIFAFSATTAVSAILCGTLLFIGRRAGTRIFRKEALCVIGLGWILVSLVGAIPYVLTLDGHTIADAIFESASGFTTTGASVLTNLEEMPRSLIFWRALSQWIGGLGFVVFFIAILSFLGVGGKILFASESTALSTDIDQPRVQKSVLQFIYIYLILSAACVIALRLAGMGWYDAICHMFATISTGGFGTRTESIAVFDSPAIEWVLVLFMMLGATSFSFYVLLWERNWKQIKRSTEVQFYWAMLAVVTLLFFFFLVFGNITDDLHHAIRAAAFQVVSISTTSGFVTEDFDQWPLFCRMAMLSLMIIGGCSASTAGGLKAIRLVIFSRVTLRSIERAFRARVVRPVIVNGKQIDQIAQDNVAVYTALTFLVLIISLPLFAFLEPGHSLDGSISAVFACFFNVGPAFAEFGPIENYFELNSPAKILLSLLMIMGRLEMFAILVLFSPSLWRKFS